MKGILFFYFKLAQHGTWAWWLYCLFQVASWSKAKSPTTSSHIRKNELAYASIFPLDRIMLPETDSATSYGSVTQKQFDDAGSYDLVHPASTTIQTLVGESSFKEYLCKVCGKSFSNSKDCRRHTIIHSNKKPYKCPYCDHTANLKFNMTKHVQRMHTIQYEMHGLSLENINITNNWPAQNINYPNSL